jgi:hypothetical protein
LNCRRRKGELHITACSHVRLKIRNLFSLNTISIFNAILNLRNSTGPAPTVRLIPMSVQDETKARWIPGCWRDASEAHIRSDLQRASNEASRPEDKRISLILNAIWN